MTLLDIAGCYGDGGEFYFLVGDKWVSGDIYRGEKGWPVFQRQLSNFLSLCYEVCKDYPAQFASHEPATAMDFDPFITGIRLIQGKPEFKVKGVWLPELGGAIYPIQIFMFLITLGLF